MADTDPFFGPEVVDQPLGATIVRDVKAATAYIVGTAPVHLAHADAAAWAPYVETDVIIRSAAEATAAFGPVTAGYTIPTALDAIFDQALTKGVGTIVVRNVFDPATHQDEDDEPDPAAVTAADIIGAFGTGGVPKGLKGAYGCYQKFGWFPKFLAAPGFNMATGVRAELEVICNRIRARTFLDAPAAATRQDVIEARGNGGDFNWQLNNRRIVLCWPEILVARGASIVAEPYSSRLLGVWLSSILEHGYHHSPSNRPIFGIEGTTPPVLYIPGDASSDAQLLRGAGIVTTQERWGQGPHTAGNRSAAYPVDTDMRNFLHVQFIQDMLDEAVLFYLDQFADRNASPARIERVEEDVNAFIRSKTAVDPSSGQDPALYDGRFWFDRTKTTPQTIANGQLYYQLEFAPVGVMERITVERGINIDLIRDPLGLATATDDSGAF